MIQPNFLDLDWRVRRAIDLVEANPDKPSSSAYEERLKTALHQFRATNKDTDQTYTQWRMLRGRQMTAFRDLRLTSDRARALCDEHALDDYPSQRIVYTDEDELIAFVTDAIEYLKQHVDEWKWVGQKITALESGIEGAAQLKLEEKAAFRLYVARAKERVSTYDRLYSTFRSYLSDARNDMSSDPKYVEIRLEYV